MCKKNSKPLRPIHSWAYIAGLIETDGTFSLRLDKNGYFFATVAITQKNKDLLVACQLFFQKYQLNAIFDSPKKKKTTRAPSIRIRGPLQVLKLLFFLQKKSNPDEKPFCSQKYRDFLVMIYTLKHRDILSSEQKIDLVMTLHKVHQNQPDLVQYSSKKTRQQHELDLGLKKNQSLGAAYNILKNIDAIYQRHCKTDLSVLVNTFKDDWYLGLIDGDGYFGLRLRVNKKSISFYPVFSLGMETNALLTAEVFQKKLNNIGTIRIRIRKNSVEWYVGGDELRLLRFFCCGQLYHPVKQAQLDCISHWLELKESNALNDPNQLKILVQQCYTVNQLGKGRNLKYTLDQMFNFIETNL